MRRQATQGDVDFITGDYLAEMNLADHAEKMAAGQHDGWEPTAWDGIEQTLDVLNEKRIKLVFNGGALNPAGLARKTQALVVERGYDLQVSYVTGDNLVEEVRASIQKTGKLPAHLDSENDSVTLAESATSLLDTKGKPIVSANAYLGARGILAALKAGADIVICGRVADASPVIGAAWYWHDWTATSYDELAGALVAGHLIECSAYVTGSNFCAFNEYPLSTFIDLPFGIAEIAQDGTTVITKHPNTNGLVNVDNVTTQFLYELQGTIYLNSDVSADCTNIQLTQAGPNRVQLSGIKGFPPPPTTKLAIFYNGGYESQLLFNATGYATQEKYMLTEQQVRYALTRANLLDKFQLLDFQVIGTPAPDPRSQFSSTTYLRILAQADAQSTLLALLKAFSEYVGMQHFSGFHCSLDMRTAIPRSYLAFYPALYPQDSLDERAVLLPSSPSSSSPSNPPTETTISAGHPPTYAPTPPRTNFDTPNPQPLSSFGPTTPAKLGDLVLARSGDKGANINIGFFVRDPKHHPWLQAFLTRDRLRELMGDDWREPGAGDPGNPRRAQLSLDERDGARSADDVNGSASTSAPSNPPPNREGGGGGYHIERCEFPHLLAVHFVIYGPLGRGVSSCRLLDALGKGFADYVRDRVVQVPVGFLADVEGIREGRREEIRRWRRGG